MKWMKWIGVCAVIVAMGLATSGCGSDSDGGGGLEGSWTATTFNGQPLPDGVAASITISGNGTYTGFVTEEGITVTEVGTWSTSGSQLITVHGGETETVTYALSGNTLVLSDPEGVFTFTRQ